MKKAMMGSMTDSVIKSASCACLVVKPQVRHTHLKCQHQLSLHRHRQLRSRAAYCAAPSCHPVMVRCHCHGALLHGLG